MAAVPGHAPDPGRASDPASAAAPRHLDLDRRRGLTVHWADGRVSFFPVAHLRRMSPAADSRELRRELASNLLTVLPSRPLAGPLEAVSAELVGNYALRIRFSDGHSGGIYSWRYLREIDPGAPAPESSGPAGGDTTDAPTAAPPGHAPSTSSDGEAQPHAGH